MSDHERHDRFLETHLDASLDELAALVAQPSIAAQNLGMEDCARQDS
jgi:hypothetical protein